ncbi:MAG: hypothetical protein EPO16_05870, partial [Dehalococcoidia bacterium]
VALGAAVTGLALLVGLLVSSDRRAQAAASTQNLHATDVTVGSTTYNTMNTSAVTGTIATATAVLADKNLVYTFADGAGVQTFVSDAVPTGATWAIGGAWTFNAYVKASTSTRMYLRAVILRIGTDGTATTLATTGFTTRMDVTTAYGLISWNYTLAANTLTGGQRFGVRFQVQPDSNGPTATLGFDASTAASNVVAQITSTPDAPTSVVATPGSGQASVTWVAPASNGGSAITGYTVTASPGGQTATVGGSTLTATVTGLTNGTAYTFTVTATNAIGTGPASAASNSVTPATAPGPPTSVSATAGNAQATVTWVAPASNGGSAITGYTVTSSPGGLTATVGGSTLTATVTGLTNGTAYTFTVTASNAAATSVASAPSNSVTPSAAPTAPGAPTSVVATAGNTQATVTWVAPASDGGSAILGYTVTASPGGGTAAVGGSTLTATVTGLTNGTAYTFTVTATNAIGTGPASAASNSVTPSAGGATVPGAPQTVAATAGNGQATVTWTAPASDGGSVITGYTVTSSPGAFTATVNGSTFSATVTGLTNATSYTFTVTATNSIGTGPASAASNAVIPGAVPDPPTAVSGTGGNGYVLVTWTAPVNNGGSAITSYTATSSPGGFNTSVDGASNSASVTGLTNGTAYTFTVTATNAIGTSAPSAASAPVTPSTSGWPALPAMTPPAHNSHATYTVETAACARCHRVHTSPAPRVLYKTWPEENVCYTCHDGSAAPNVMSQFAKTYKMPLTATAGIHSNNEPRTRNPASFTGANRHIECADCHNPHLAGAGVAGSWSGSTSPGSPHTIGSNYTFGPQQSVWGIAVTNTAAWTAPTFATTYPITMQYQLCFKCHSSWAYGTSPPTSPSGGFVETDQAKEFNTLNNAYHPVEDVGKNPFLKSNGSSYASSLIGGFTPTGRMVCSDCHRSETTPGVTPTDPAGPHGSTNPFILRGQWDRTTGQAGTSNHLCFNCHAWTTYSRGSTTAATGFYDGVNGKGNLHGIMVGGRNKANADAEIVCMDCHVAIPHGYYRDHLLGFTGDGAPYINRPYSGGLTSIDQWRASGTWIYDSCGTAMSSCK